MGRTRRSTVRENNKNHKRSERIQARSATVATRHNADPSASHYLTKDNLTYVRTTVPRLCPPFVNNNTASSNTAGKHMMTYLEVSLPFWSRSLNELKQPGSNEGHKALRAFQLPAVHPNFSSASIQCRCAIPQANFP